MFLNKIDLPYRLVVFFIVCPRFRSFSGAPNDNGKYLFGRRFEIKIFGTFVVKFLARLPLLGFSNI